MDKRLVIDVRVQGGALRVGVQHEGLAERHRRETGLERWGGVRPGRDAAY